MGMKAERGRVIERKESSVPRDPKPGDGWKDRKEVEFPENKLHPLSEEDKGSNPDELIMVMMPRVTWEAFEGLAVMHGGGAAQAMSTALKLLEKALEEKTDEEMKDGT